ncbi:MAG TPA: universal stress protein [Baekduia sp.]|uniref:universal stress protein n=1 Tax=Baekduia sp. TaxID=2600305 RepID=UPI002D78DFCC|nr:universal stress protein [Baekduia sp.]HET6506076.1 universal stress protein [Baekduia sp.]
MSTFTKVIVGDDRQDGGADALALARALAPGAELILATTHPGDPVLSRARQPAYDALLHDDAEAALARRRDEAGLPADTRLLVRADSSPARGLHRLAAAEEAGLIVVGSARHGAVGRLLLGSVGRAVLYGAPCPVAVAPRGFAARAAAPRTIGVAYDHGPEARHALDVAIDVARDVGAAVTIREVVAADLLPAVAGYPMMNVAEISRDLLDNARTRLDAVVAELPADGVEVTSEAVLGTSAERLEELADETDLMITGSRGYGPVRRVMLGSTADRLIHHAPCPVLVVPRGADD